MSSSPEHARLLRLATRASVAVASLLIITKAIAWWLSGSISMLAAAPSRRTAVGASAVPPIRTPPSRAAV